MEEKNQMLSGHKVLLQGRKLVQLNGVKEVVSFDAGEVVLNTQMGLLFVRGNDMRVKRLTVEQGEVDLEGKIDSLIYSEKPGKAGEQISFWKKLFQ